MIQRTALAVITLYALSGPALGHPHDGDRDILVLKGTITAVDLKNGTLALDAIDRSTKRLRNFFVFLDPKIKVTRAKKKIPMTELAAGQPVICTVEVDAHPSDIKLIAFEIQVDLKAIPATR